MRKLIFGINLTLDGCCDHTKVSGGDPEIHDYFAQHIRDADTLVYGRKTYQLMVPYWPDIAKNPSGQTRSIADFAQAFAGVKEIIVFSRTLAQAEGTNARVVRTNLKDEILKLKNEPGKDILVGGVDLPSQLMELDLIDEYRFIIHPRIVGEGRRLWDSTALREKLQLRLAGSQVFRSGAIALRYLKNAESR
jgi:dihydrofolate reductase